MDFVAVMEQAIALLRQRGRVAYRTLQRQFQLDDAAIEDLKIELIDAQHLARDEQGRILVWQGDPGTPLSPLPSSAHAAPPATPEAARPQTPPSSAAPTMPEAERRQLTVLFCDLVDSTVLASQLDPEDLREVVRAYQDTCAKVIARFEGYIAQYLGDGLLVYFGYPLAHEDDAQRAVRAGLGMVEAVGQLNTRLAQERGVQLAVRLGIHTGLVVVGEIGGGTRQEQLALGETPNLAARLQGIATPNTLVISATTFQLLGEFFACQPLGTPPLKGQAQPLAVYRVLYERMVRSRLEAVGTTGLTPLVGREQEVALLRERWVQVKEGIGQVVLLGGEAGIGKSRLVQVLKEHVAAEPQAGLTPCQCSPYHQHSALHPWIELLERVALRFEPEETPQQKLHKLEGFLVQYGLPLAETMPLLAPFLSLPLTAEYAPLALAPAQQKQHTLHALLTILLRIAAQQPVLFVMEDLHWVDPTTLEWLTLLVDQGPTARILALLTFRPDFTPPWTGRSHLTQVTLHRLPRQQATEMTGRVAHGKALPPEVVAQVVAKTDGVPLFVEELTKMVLESGLLQEREDRYELTGPLPPLAIPTTLHDSLMARLDRLATVKGLAQLGATLGREFSYALLHAVSPWDEATLQQGLHQLVAAEFLYQQGLPPQATYRFKHALIQDTAYQSLLRSTRQQHHQRIAQVLEAHFPALCENQPELLAHHSHHGAGPAQDAAGDACAYPARAGGAPGPGHPAGPDEGPCGAGGGNHVCPGLRAVPAARRYAAALRRAAGPAALLFHAGELPTARDLAEQLLRLALRLDDRGLVVRAHHMLEEDLLFLGEFAQVRAHAEQGIALYDPAAHQTQVVRYGNDSGVGCRIFAAVALWALGYPDQAVQRSDEALAWAQELAHPFNLVFALTHAARLHLFRREPHRVLAWADAAVTLAREQSFAHFLAQASMLRGWALVEQGQGAAGLAQLRQGLTAWRATGAQPRPLDFALLAGVYGQMAQPAEGLRVLAEAQAVAETRREQFWAAELHRLRGALVLQSGGRAQHSGGSTPPLEEAEVERCVCQALDIARRQDAKSLELRAAMSLARLWQQQGKRAEAHALLAPIYGWFTEGFGTADLQEAKVLLEELAG